jgi:hypothetical protein
LLQYLTQLIESKVPELADWSRDMPHIENASKISLDTVVQEVKGLQQTIDKVSKELKDYNPQDKENDAFSRVFQQWREESQKEVEQLNTNLFQCLEAFKFVSAYFGEEDSDAKMSKHLFSIVYNFSVAFEVIITKKIDFLLYTAICPTKSLQSEIIQIY